MKFRIIAAAALALLLLASCTITAPTSPVAAPVMTPTVAPSAVSPVPTPMETAAPPTTIVTPVTPAVTPSTTPSAGPSGIPTVSPVLAAPDTDFSKPGIYEVAGYRVIGYGVDQNTTYNIDMNGDGKPGPLTIRVDYGNGGYVYGENGNIWDTVIGYGGQNTELDDVVIAYGAVMIRPNGGAALFITTQGLLDDEVNTLVFTVKGGTLQQADAATLTIKKLDFNSMDVGISVNYFLGGQGLYGTVGLSDDFTIIYPADGYFNVEQRADPETEAVIAFPYTAKVDLPAKKLVSSPDIDELPSGQYVDAVMPAGTQINPLLMTFDRTQAIVESSDGAHWLLTAVRSSDNPWPSYQLADGTLAQEPDVFDGCHYAGP